MKWSNNPEPMPDGGRWPSAKTAVAVPIASKTGFSLIDSKLMFMKILPVLFIGALVFLSACCTSRKEGYQQAYEGWLTDGRVQMSMLHTLDSGDIQKTKRLISNLLLLTLDGLPDFAAKAHPTPQQKQDELKLARDVLDYMMKHREDFDPRLASVRLGVRRMQKILTEPDDVLRLAELSDYLAGVKKKLETQKP